MVKVISILAVTFSILAVLIAGYATAVSGFKVDVRIEITGQ